MYELRIEQMLYLHLRKRFLYPYMEKENPIPSTKKTSDFNTPFWNDALNFDFIISSTLGVKQFLLALKINFNSTFIILILRK